MDQRFADAVRARRAELRGLRGVLAGGHRPALRARLALVRLAAEERLALALTGVADAGRHWIARAGRMDRAALPRLLGAALERVTGEVLRAADVQARVAAAGVAGRMLPEIPAQLARTASVRVPVAEPGGPAEDVRVPGPAEDPAAGPLLPEPPPPRPWWRTLPAAVAPGPGFLRLVLLAAPAWGLPAAGGRELLPLAVGLAVAAAAVLAHRRAAAAERERWRRWLTAAVDEARRHTQAELTRILVVREQRAVELLDAAAASRRRSVDAELRALEPADAA